MRELMLKTLQSCHNDVLREMLRERRVAQRLRQADLAALLGRGQGTVSKVERGERRLDVIELRHWLTVMGVDFVEFARDLDVLLKDVPTLDARLQRGGRRISFSRRGRGPEGDK
jgi:transcriptional regulator with XRE-family HTH domain